MTSLLSGFGVNDSDYLVAPRKGPKCPYYKRWMSMIQRCYSEKLLAKRPSYYGCFVSEDWRKFSDFKSWMITQDWEGMELDKDLITPGNKCYSPETCTFVPAKVNTLLVSTGDHGSEPLGVNYRKTWVKPGTVEVRDRPGMRYEANCSRKYLGKFSTSGEAHRAWQIQKVKDIESALSEFPELDPRVVDSLRKKVVEINYQIDNCLETTL